MLSAERASVDTGDIDVRAAGRDRPAPARRRGRLGPVEQRGHPEPERSLSAVEGDARDVTSDVTAAKRLDASEARFRVLLSQMDLGAVTLNASGKVLFINDHLLAILGRPRDEILGRDWIGEAIPVHERTGLRRMFRRALKNGHFPASREAGIVTRSGEERRLSWTDVVLRDNTGRAVELASIAHDVTAVHALEAERALFATAVEQTTDAVVVTDAAFTVMFVNSAFERVSGYLRDEVVGKHDPFLAAKLSEPAVAEALRSTLHAGGAWHCDLPKRRKDGTEHTASVTIKPIFDATGAPSAYISVQHDVSLVRALEAELVLEAAVRALLDQAIQAGATSSGLEETAQAVCDGLASLPGIHTAQLVAFLGEENATLVASHEPDGSAPGLGDRLPEAAARYLQERAASGAWGERSGSKHGYWQVVDDMGASGVQALAFGPIGHPDHPVGVLIVGTRDRQYATVVAEKMPPLVAFGASANTLLVQHLETRRREDVLRGAIEATLKSRDFRIVFQPIVELASGDTIGYEALSRFHSGQQPASVFADAWSIGMGADLELATLETAIAEATKLPAGRWLNLNVSPRLLDAPGRLSNLLMSAGRPVVVEITEHDRITDYCAVRGAVAALGDDVRLAVDDAGVGIANFGHIIGLRPDFVKIDLSLVNRVNADPGRQALVVAMRHFARTAGCRLVAEGIETEEEARALRQLGVEFGQGFWFGRPETAERWQEITA